MQGSDEEAEPGQEKMDDQEVCEETTTAEAEQVQDNNWGFSKKSEPEEAEEEK